MRKLKYREVKKLPKVTLWRQEEAHLGIEPRQSGSRLRIPVNKCRKNEENGKSPLVYHNNCCWKDQLNAKICGQP